MAKYNIKKNEIEFDAKYPPLTGEEAQWRVFRKRYFHDAIYASWIEINPMGLSGPVNNLNIIILDENIPYPVKTWMEWRELVSGNLLPIGDKVIDDTLSEFSCTRVGGIPPNEDIPEIFIKITNNTFGLPNHGIDAEVPSTFWASVFQYYKPIADEPPSEIQNISLSR